MHGANRPLIQTAKSSSGISPRARGEQFHLRVWDEVCGNTPACTGRTYYWSSRLPHFREYPACTGTTLYSTGRLHCGREYPRVHGDNRQPLFDILACVGIPPCVRGRLPDATQLCHQLWNTPVCTGTTRLSGAGHRGGTEYLPVCTGTTCYQQGDCHVNREYPRVYGDNPLEHDLTPWKLGIPPRARGQLGGNERRSHQIWNTPACTGTTQAYGCFLNYVKFGIPPHTRGQRTAHP